MCARARVCVCVCVCVRACVRACVRVCVGFVIRFLFCFVLWCVWISVCLFVVAFSGGVLSRFETTMILYQTHHLRIIQNLG